MAVVARLAREMPQPRTTSTGLALFRVLAILLIRDNSNSHPSRRPDELSRQQSPSCTLGFCRSSHNIGPQPPNSQQRVLAPLLLPGPSRVFYFPHDTTKSHWRHGEHSGHSKG